MSKAPFLYNTVVVLVQRAIRIRGAVQGVGFRPMTWHLAHELGTKGTVCNDAQGVLIKIWIEPDSLSRFLDGLKERVPPLAVIQEIEVDDEPDKEGPPADFIIVESEGGTAGTQIVPDAAVCDSCCQEIFNPSDRRYRYPFTTCTKCGPRLSIIRSLPYDRSNTTMDEFALCPKCAHEYKSPCDRRFHAEATACADCGPQLRLFPQGADTLDAIGKCTELLRDGKIIAVKGTGGFHLAVDATNEQAVATLRKRKQRPHKPFALMARDLDVIRRFAEVSEEEEKSLTSVQSPIVLLTAFDTKDHLASSVAPRQNTLGFMLPYTPLHKLIMANLDFPIVLTSGNRSEEPQCLADEEAKTVLAGIADYILTHNREITNRLDDSVIKVLGGSARLLRRARGFAPAGLPVNPNLLIDEQVLAMGAELKNTFCLLQDGQAILSQHIGDLEEAKTNLQFRSTLEFYRRLFSHNPSIVAIDSHPEYLSSKLGRELCEESGAELVEVQHHHAHIAACMAENGWFQAEQKVIGVALDGLGFGPDGTIWGGEFLLCDYLDFARIGCLAPVRLLGGVQSIRQPWRNAYSHLRSFIDRATLENKYGDLELVQLFERQPVDTLESMLKSGFNSPYTSSCGRLFDAVASAIGICASATTYEGQAAIELEAATERSSLIQEAPYDLRITEGHESGLLYLDSTHMWTELLHDCKARIDPGAISARFHKGLANAIVKMVEAVRERYPCAQSVALSGGVFQNKILFELVEPQLRSSGFQVLTHRRVPSNDGGLSLGQAVVAAARSK